MAKAFSIEDGTLNSASIVTARTVNYKDVDLSFLAKPSGDIYKKIDAAAVKQAVKNVLLTNPGEKPFLPTYGGGLSGLLFDLLDDDAEDEIEDAVRLAVSNYEPRAKIISIDTNAAPDYNSIRLKINFQVVSTNEIVVLETAVTRVR